MKDNKSILIPEATYHIYNRANGNELMFTNDANYDFFLKKYKQYIPSIADTFCYCLMPNHFHFLLRIKSEKELLKTLPGLLTSDRVDATMFSHQLSRQFSHLLNGYAQAFNKQEMRKGSLFMRPYKRKMIRDEQYLKKLVHYIHYNPVNAELAEKPEQWKYSSYNSILSPLSSQIVKEEVIGWFGDFDNFIYCHKSPPRETGLETF